MPDNNKTDEFLQKLAPCIERGELEACVEEAARVAGEMGIGAEELLDLSSDEEMENKLAYILALAAAQDLEGEDQAESYFNAAIAANELGMKLKEEEHYKNAIDIDPEFTDAHYNYAVLLYKQKKIIDAKLHYKKAIELDPKFIDAHYGYAYLLYKQGRENKNEAELHYKKAIELDPNNAKAHGAYGFLLLEYGNRRDSWKETEIASNLFKEKGRITTSHLVKAFFYLKYSIKNLNLKNYSESSKDAYNAGEELLKAAETADGSLKNNLTLQGNILKAKSFVRKIPEKSRYKPIFYRSGSDLTSELIENLKNAAIYYEKASQCSVGERKDLCNACFYSINVFSETLSAVKGNDTEINKNKWLSSLEQAHKIYTDKNSNNGVALVETLKQLIKCADGLVEHRKFGLKTQEKRLGKCYKNLIDVSEKLDGAFKIISDYAAEAISDYAIKKELGFIEEIKPKKSFFDNWIVKAGIVLGIIASIIKILQFFNLDSIVLTVIKSLISRIGSP